MIYYASGKYTDEVLDYFIDKDLSLLSSFAYAQNTSNRTRYLAAKLRGTGKKLNHMLDSGAFTAWAQGTTVDLDQLCTVVNRALDNFGDVFNWSFVALDVIPGVKGTPATVENVMDACQQSVANYQTMLRKCPVDADILPVFHVGEPEWVIDIYKTARHIGIGLSQNVHEKDRVAWARRNQEVFKGQHLHGLAATGWDMLRCAPWYSVDSASWLAFANYGRVMIPKLDGSLYPLTVSQESGRKQTRDAHYLTLSDVHRMEVDGLVEELGHNIDTLKTSYTARWLWNLDRYRDMCQAADRWYQHYGRQQALAEAGLFA